MSHAQQVLSDFVATKTSRNTYAHVVEETAAQVEANPAQAASIIRQAGSRYGVSVPQRVIDEVEAALAAGTESQVDEAEVDFLTDAQVEALVEVASQAGYRGSEADLRNSFITVGLLPEPEPEPEPEAPEEDDSSLLRRLVAFAKQHGFK